jgi:hypothetical protein
MELDESIDSACVLFAKNRTELEFQIAFASLCDPALAVTVAHAVNLEASSFGADLSEGAQYEPRLIFCACCIAWERGRQVVFRLARKALADCQSALGEGVYLSQAVKATGFVSDDHDNLPLSLFLNVEMRRLLAFNATTRDASAHIGHARSMILKRLGIGRRESKLVSQLRQTARGAA